jgi:hypothetical protein
VTDDHTGDAACWLGQVCDVCGGFVDDRSEHQCRQAVDGANASSAPPPQDQ